MSIECNALTFAYFEDGRDCLHTLDANFSRGEITLLTGASGCGKSTLLSLLAGIYPHSAGVLRGGAVRVEGQDPSALPPEKRCALVGMMFQNPELQFCMDTVEREVIFCLENIAVAPEDIPTQVDAALHFCEITHLKKRTLHTLSGGEKQRVQLACLVALNPNWLLLDEPFANIDDQTARAIVQKLLELHNARGTGILAVDHRLSNWLGIADCVHVMDKGVLLDDSMRPDALDHAQLQTLGIGIPEQTYAPELPAKKTGEVVLTLDGLCVSHGGREVLHDVSASFRRGGIYAILGASGGGKSTLFGALSGLYRYGGSATLTGREVKKLRRREAGLLGLVTQNPQDQFLGGTVAQELPAAHCEEILRSIQLWKYRDVSPHLLSQGQQRRLGVAALMAHDCAVLLCDEPTYAQDYRNTRTIMQGLCRSAREDGIALIFSTHDTVLARDFADEIFELREGTLYACEKSGM